MKKEPLKLQSILSFGKYTGMTVREVIMIDPNYLKWIYENTDYKISDYLIQDYIYKNK